MFQNVRRKTGNYYIWLETALHFSLRSLEGKGRIKNIKYSLYNHLYPFTILYKQSTLAIFSHSHAPTPIVE